MLIRGVLDETLQGIEQNPTAGLVSPSGHPPTKGRRHVAIQFIHALPVLPRCQLHLSAVGTRIVLVRRVSAPFFHKCLSRSQISDLG